MMRIYLIVMIAFALIASYGCSDKKSAGRTPEETAKMARNGGGSSATGDNGFSNPGMDAERKRRMEESQQTGSGEEGGEESAGESGDDEGSGKSSDEITDGSEGQNDSGLDGDENTKAKPPVRESTRTGARRRKKVSTPSMGGGNMDELRKSREDAKKKQNDEVSKEKDDDQASNTERRSARDRDEQPEEKVVSLYDRAKSAFSANHDTEGFQFLYAHYLVDDDALSNYPMSWYTGISEPRVALRWGVAVDYNPGAFEGDPPKIGDPVEKSESGGRSRSGSGGSDFGGPPSSGAGGGNVGISSGRQRRVGAGNRQRNQQSSSNQSRGSRRDSGRSPEEELEYYTGDFGEKLIRRYEMRRRHSDAFYGLVMKEIDTKLTEEDGSGDADNTSRSDDTPRRPGGGGGDFGSLGGGSSDLARGRRNRDQGNRNSRSGSGDADYEAEETSVAPGLMFVGVGHKNQMLANAKSLNLDVLVVFEVKVKHTERRNGDTSTKSNTRLVVYSVKTGDLLQTNSKSLSNLAVAAAREKDGDDPVELELDKVFGEMADEKFKSREMPELDADAIGKRYAYLLKKEYSNPLPVLVEIKNYLDSGLLSQNEYIAACEQLLGEVSAQDLIDGDAKKKEAALKDYLPGKFTVKTDTGGDDDFR